MLAMMAVEGAGEDGNGGFRRRQQQRVPATMAAEGSSLG